VRQETEENYEERIAVILTENLQNSSLEPYSYTDKFGGTGWRLVVSFTSQPLYPQRKILQYPLDRGQGHKAAPVMMEERQIFPFAGNRNLILRSPSQVSTPTEPTSLCELLQLCCLAEDGTVTES
jgi:hypothetical protein